MIEYCWYKGKLHKILKISYNNGIPSKYLLDSGQVITTLNPLDNDDYQFILNSREQRN